MANKAIKVLACGFNVQMTEWETEVLRLAKQGKANVHDLNLIMDSNGEILCEFQKKYQMWSEENIKNFFWYKWQYGGLDTIMTTDEFNWYLATEFGGEYQGEEELLAFQEEADPEDYDIIIKENK